ncbi:MAG: magnesium/cobalt transporter CorA [Mariniblastus sp.]
MTDTNSELDSDHKESGNRISIGSTVFRKRSPEVGARPGTLAVGEESVEPRIRLIRYDMQPGSVAKDERVDDIQDLRVVLDADAVTWIDVQGFGDLETIERIGEMFSIHPLALEDMVNVPQRPKAEIYGENVLIITRMVGLDQNNEVQMEQVAVLLSKNFVITFQEQYGDILDPLRERIGDSTSRMRKHGSDYLMYAIVDTIVDGYYPVIDKLGDHLEELENRVMENPSTESLVELNKTKNLLVNLRRAVWPQREAVNSMVRDDNTLISQEVRLFLRDTYDHCIQSAEVIEMYREMATGLINIYLSSVANRSNEVMKVLTIMASIFIPLTFMAGIYGMNFEYMPELKFRWAYPIFWGVMTATGVGMVVYFWRKGWIGKK